jgi:hypothetical protein
MTSDPNPVVCSGPGQARVVSFVGNAVEHAGVESGGLILIPYPYPHSAIATFFFEIPTPVFLGGIEVMQFLASRE